jgi:hypothetical protein
MIRKRCGVNLGRAILNQAKRAFEVNDFWRVMSPLNRAVKKVSKGEWQRKRAIIAEITNFIIPIRFCPPFVFSKKYTKSLLPINHN